ncbi:MAG: ATP synthase F0 subunit B [Clostridiales bacterium]|nr:ATP synthase F0 subunit B [Clostridiales bacterium]
MLRWSMLSALPEGRLFGLDRQLLISVVIQLFNACVLAVALSVILYKPVQQFLNDRTKRVRDQMERAAYDTTQAKRLKLQYEEKLREIEQERLRVLEEARAQAAERGAQTLEQAKREAATTRARAEADARREQERVEEEMRVRIIEVAAALAEKFVSHTIDQDTQDRLFRETMAELEETTWPA